MDERLMRRVMKGDMKAFAALVDHYQEYVMGIGYRFLGTREDAEDVAQEERRVRVRLAHPRPGQLAPSGVERLADTKPVVSRALGTGPHWNPEVVGRSLERKAVYDRTRPRSRRSPGPEAAPHRLRQARPP